MAEDVGALQIRLQATAARFEADMQRATRSMERATGRMEKRASGLDKRLSDVGSRFGVNIPTGAVAATAAIAGIGLAIRGVVKAGETMKLMQGRFEALTGSASRGAEAVRQVFATSARTGDSVEAVGQLTQRFLLAGETLGATDEQVARFTENLLKLGRIGGSSASEITNGSTQLSQALAGGVVRAEEFNSVLENTPMVAKAIADGLGVGIGQLRQMVLDGRLLSRDVFDVLLGQTDDIDAAFQKIPQTTEQATTRMRNALTLVGASIDENLQLSNTWVAALNAVASALEAIAGTSDAAAARVRNQLSDARAELADAEASGNSYRIGAARATVARLERQLPPPVEVPAAVTPIATPAASGGGGGGRRAATSTGADEVDRAIKQLTEMTVAVYNQGAAMKMTAREQASFAAELEAFAVGADLSSEKLSELREEYIAAAEALFDMKEAQEAASRAQDEANRFADQLISGFSQAAQQADSFKDALKRLGIQLLEVAARGAFLKEGPFAALGQAIGPALGSLFGGSAAAPAIPGRASGGPVSAGRPYIVGEKRPELFVPRTAGTIIPRVPSGGGQNISITVDARGANDAGMVEAAARRGAAEALATLQAGPGFARMVRNSQARRG